MTKFSTATALLALSSAANAAGIQGGFQSGPSDGAFYSGGMTYIPNQNRAFFTGSHYNEGISPADVSAGEMVGTGKDTASSCYVAKLDYNDEVDGDTYHSLTDWISYGNPGKIETCSAVAGTKGSDVYVVGSVADGGLFSDGYPMQGLLSILNKEDLSFIDATLIKSAEDPNKHMIYPLDVIHDYHRKFVYVAALTSTDAVTNEVTTDSKDMPNWQQNHLLGSAFDVTVIKIRTPNGSKPEAIWVQHFPLDVEPDGSTPPVFVAGMALQTDMNGVQHLLVSGSTRGSGEAFGRAAPDSIDEDGFIMQLKLADGSFVKHDRHEGMVYDYQDDLREGTPSDDFIRGMCNNLGKGHETHGQSDTFYIVGGTKGDMTTDAQGPQNLNGNAGFQFGAGVEARYKNQWVREESLMPFLRKVSISTLKPVWTTQWAAMPKKNSGTIPTNAYAMDCYVNNAEKAVFVVGSVMKDAIMTQGDVEMVNQGGDDIWVAKIDEETGNVFWLTQLGSTEADYVARRGAIAVNNEGNVIIYGDTNGSMYRPRDTAEDPANTDMFLMTIDGKTGAVLDDIYMGGTSSGSAAQSINGIPPLVNPKPPTTPEQPMTPSTPVNDVKITKEHSHSKAGVGFGIFFGVVFGMLGLFFFMNHRMKKRKAEAQKSSIFSCLQQFDVEDIDLRRSPPGGWHGTYMNKLAHGHNNADDLALETSGAEGAPLTHASVANDALFMDSEGGYRDNEFSIEDDDEVDIRINANKIV